MRTILAYALIILVSVSTGSANSAEDNSFDQSDEVVRPKLFTKSEPIRESFMASLAADDFDKPEKAKTAMRADNKTASSGSKSRFKAIALSALWPGAGELYLGNKKTASGFFVAEALIIAGYVSYKLAASEKQDDLIRYAETYAGVSATGKSDLYLDMVGFYTDNDHYNSEGRVGDPDRPFYPDDEVYHWRWQSEVQRSTYRELKNRQGQLSQKSDFVLTMAVANRVVSVITTAISSRRISSRSGQEFSSQLPDSFRLSLEPVSTNRQLVLTWHTSLF